jgi:hypothetical protein
MRCLSHVLSLHDLSLVFRPQVSRRTALPLSDVDTLGNVVNSRDTLLDYMTSGLEWSIPNVERLVARKLVDVTRTP